MDKQLFEFIISQGSFAVLFLYLLFYVLKENSKREEVYQKVISELSVSLPNIKKDIEEIKNKIS
ncbi:BhlA/UviB family holin-like peptide [Clostridium sp.]|uniref:BhlA/UviB family holin-like peptide n=1 Tax=Clostridium sp. TaxID=1506 RepID=UPI0026DC9C27|nr:BhlA/UviB family holin-like peptide [Clostridium sp.]MDO5040116.1 BhlA/UviB family holin-like peptide [Clostridium sp.]